MELRIGRGVWVWEEGYDDTSYNTSFNDWSCISRGDYYCGSLSSHREPPAAKPGRKERRAYERIERRNQKKKGRKEETPSLSIFLPKYGEGPMNKQKIKSCFKWQKMKKKVGKHARQVTGRSTYHQISSILESGR